MSRTVMCRKYHEELPGLDRPPYPGAKGEDIYNNVSRKAWDEAGVGGIGRGDDHQVDVGGLDGLIRIGADPGFWQVGVHPPRV
ncbi:Fe(2+)-trafficking protein, partial [Pseudomonas aeruginosa]|uniref:Fe(2+)-trafficking protein n=1 Tax=Pseudomonas aeruginosa TaxID=287 RepID=UPI00209B7E95